MTEVKETAVSAQNLGGSFPTRQILTLQAPTVSI